MKVLHLYFFSLTLFCTFFLLRFILLNLSVIFDLIIIPSFLKASFSLVSGKTTLAIFLLQK